MSALSTLLTDLSTYISQSSTGNITNDQRVRYLSVARTDLANSRDWPFLHKETALTVALAGTDNGYDTASMPSDIKGRKIMSIYYVPNLDEYDPLDENEFLHTSGSHIYTIVGQGSATEQIRIKSTSGATADADAFLNDQATSSSSTTAVTSFLTAPDVPRQILFTPGGTTGDVAAGNIVVVGEDMYGTSQTENVAIVANQTTTSTTTAHFRTLTSITFPQMDGNGATFDVGTNSNVGLAIRYIQTLTAYSAAATGAVSGFPDEMDELIVLGAAYRIFMKFNRDRRQPNSYQAEYFRLLDQCWKTYDVNVKTQRRRIVNDRERHYSSISKTRY